MRKNDALTLRKSGFIQDWWVVEWAEHDGQEYWRPESYGMSFQRSARVSDADVEGTSMEMLDIAEAIENNSTVEYKRCAVEKNLDETFNFWSPRNSQYPETVSAESARALAVEIREKISRFRGE